MWNGNITITHKGIESGWTDPLFFEAVRRAADRLELLAGVRDGLGEESEVFRRLSLLAAEATELLLEGKVTL